jgi:hypothetical protein
MSNIILNNKYVEVQYRAHIFVKTLLLSSHMEKFHI